MRFGLFGGAARGANGGDSQSYRQFIDYVIEAEQLGFESVFLVEHHFTGAGQLSASLTLLSYLAGLTSTMRLGTGVTVLPWHNPVLLAEQAATVDLVSNGRLDFGIGKGYRPNEFHGFIVDPAQAQARFDEAIELLLKSWTSRDRFTHAGALWNFRDVVVEPHPLQAPHPPIWVAAQSEGSIRAAARKGQRLLLDQFGSTDLTAQRVAAFHDELSRNNRKFEPGMLAVTRGLLLVDCADPAKRDAELNKRIAAIRHLQETARVPGDTTPYKPQAGLMSDSREANEAAVIIGPPEECIARLQALEAAGVDYVLFNDPWGGIERLRFFAREVMPAFQKPGISASRLA